MTADDGGCPVPITEFSSCQKLNCESSKCAWRLLALLLFQVVPTKLRKKGQLPDPPKFEELNEELIRHIDKKRKLDKEDLPKTELPRKYRASASSACSQPKPETPTKRRLFDKEQSPDGSPRKDPSSSPLKSKRPNRSTEEASPSPPKKRSQAPPKKC